MILHRKKGISPAKKILPVRIVLIDNSNIVSDNYKPCG
jgi:hypothetical protein